MQEQRVSKLLLIAIRFRKTRKSYIQTARSFELMNVC